MGKKKDLLPQTIAEIRALSINTNFSQREIARRCGISRVSVQNIQKKIANKENLTPKRIGKCGKKKILTPRGERILTKIVLENRQATNNAITEKLDKSGVKMSKRTVQRRLHDLGYISRCPAMKPKLTQKMRQKRLEWAKKYRNLTEDDWKSVKLIQMQY